MIKSTCHNGRDKRNRLAALLCQLRYPSHLPVTARKADIITAIRENPVVILIGETGSGKTTQIPKMCVEAGRGTHGQIACTQPRRVAAISTATRIAEELGEELGSSVGYKIRFSDKSRNHPVIKIMTDGILLMEAQRDPFLRQYDTIIVDEAHERSLNIDFVLGIIKTVLSKRSDLKLIITSATLDSDKFSKAFDDAPTIDVSGRVYPVEIRYHPKEEERRDGMEISDPEAAALAVSRLKSERRRGDILVFMATERDVRETCELLKRYGEQGTEILPLYARLPWGQQSRIFHPGTKERIIVATNIAETSLTIPGVRYVVDTGNARIPRYSPRLRLNSLPVQGISRSSAEQRAGRCGRVAEGLCIRLYGEEEYCNRPRFTQPEIMRSNLAGVILQMLSLGIKDIAAFPFIDRPSGRSFQDGFDVLFELGAIRKRKDDTGAPELTDRGRLMASVPLDPRLSRMLIEARDEGCLDDVVTIAAALSIPDPRERPVDQEAAADQAHSIFRDRSSDFMTLLNIWKGFTSLQGGNASGNQARTYCRDHFLSYRRMREWQDVEGQIRQILKERDFRKQDALSGDDAQALHGAIHKSILSGYLANIAYKKGKNIYQGARGRELMIFPGSSLFNKSGDWIVAVEIVETSRVFARMCATIDVEWLERLGGDLCRSSYSEPHWEKNRGEVRATEKVSLFGLIIVPRRSVSYGRIAPEEATELFIREGLMTGEVKPALPFLLHNRKVVDDIVAVENKVRRSDLLVQEEMIYLFYRERLNRVYTVPMLRKFIRERGDDSFLRFTESDLGASRPDPDELSLFPDQLQQGALSFPLAYSFAPGSSQDGVTLKISPHQISQLNPQQAEWLIPGLLREKITCLLKSLPKEHRKRLLPLNKACEIILKDIGSFDAKREHFLAALGTCIRKHYGIEISREDWSLEDLPEHLKLRFAVVDDENREVIAHRDLNVLLKNSSSLATSQAFEECRKSWEQSDIRTWDFGDLPEYIEIREANGIKGTAYPALSLQEETVNLRLFSSKDEAHASHREGIIALCTLHFRDELKYLKKILATNKEVKPLTKHLGGTKRVEAALYRRILLNLFTANIRTSEEFHNFLVTVQPRILPEVQALLTILLPALTAFHECVEIIRKWQAAHRTNQPARDFLVTLDQTLDRIVKPDFIEAYSQERISHLPRYFRALILGAERGLLHLEKAMDKLGEMKSLVDELDETLANLPAFASQEKKAALDDYFWMLEEYRVSLFAQELKTPYPVSRKKLANKFAEIKLII